jgi:voltage-gated potassium channel
MLVLVGGTVGYRVIEGFTWLESAWMVAITLTTIGYGEVRPLSVEGRLFTLLLIACGLSLVSWSLTRTTRYVLEGNLKRDLDERKRRNLMAGMRNHFIIAGFGRLGLEVVEDLVHAGQKVIIVDEDPTRLTAAQARGWPTLVGDASSDDLLIEAGIQHANGLAVATGSTAVNVFVTLSARQLRSDMIILTRVHDEETAKKALRAGASHVINPHGLGGSHMAHALLRPHATDFIDLALSREYGDLAIEDVRVTSACTGTLRDLNLRGRFEVYVVAIRDSDGRLTALPSADVAVKDHDVLVVVGRPEHIAGFADALG